MDKAPFQWPNASKDRAFYLRNRLISQKYFDWNWTPQPSVVPKFLGHYLFGFLRNKLSVELTHYKTKSLPLYLLRNRSHLCYLSPSLNATLMEQQWEMRPKIWRITRIWNVGYRYIHCCICWTKITFIPSQ